jgi:hypothetical protein
MNELPQFIEPSKMQLDREDLDFLALKRAFELPEATLQNALLCAFFDHIYPLLPIIDLDNFMSAISGQGKEEEKVSLLVLQAVLAAGTCYVDMSHLRRSGYFTRDEARNVFFKRAQVCGTELRSRRIC